MKQLSEKLMRGSALNILDQFVKIVLTFVITPVIIVSLGKNSYGLWLVLMTFFGYYKLLDLGLTLSVSRFLARSLGKQDQHDFNSYANSCFVFFLTAGLISAVISTVAFAYCGVFLEKAEGLKIVRMIIAIFGVNFTLGYLVRIYRVVLRSHVRYDVLSAASLSKTILTCSLILYFLTRGYGLVTLAIIHAIGEILEHIAIYWIARKIHPGLGFSIHLFDRNRIRNMLRYSLSAFLVQFGWSLRERVDPLVIGGILGSRWVPEYSIGARFYSLFRDLTNAMFGGPFFSAYSQIEGAGERSVLANYFLKSMRFSTMLAIFGLLDVFNGTCEV